MGNIRHYLLLSVLFYCSMVLIVADTESKSWSPWLTTVAVDKTIGLAKKYLSDTSLTSKATTTILNTLRESKFVSSALVDVGIINAAKHVGNKLTHAGVELTSDAIKTGVKSAVMTGKLNFNEKSGNVVGEIMNSVYGYFTRPTSQQS